LKTAGEWCFLRVRTPRGSGSTNDFEKGEKPSEAGENMSGALKIATGHKELLGTKD